jgi:hypothetical protein
MGGQFNRISGSCFSTIGGGLYNCICNNSKAVTIPGGRNNTASGICHSVIAGGYLTGASNTTSVECLVKVTGTFSIKHPDPAKCDYMQLYHSFVETPTEGDNIYRYKVQTNNCKARVELPSYHKFLNKNDHVLVSASNHFGSGYGVIDNMQCYLDICSNKDGLYDIFILSTRKDKYAETAWEGAERIENFDPEIIPT